MSSGLIIPKGVTSFSTLVYPFIFFMIYAHNELGEKIEAYPGATAWCPLCTAQLKPKCGDINIHHWAHPIDAPDLNCIHEKETEWHLKWKGYFQKEYQEVVVINPITGTKKIADVREKSGLVLEFQHSPISPEEISIRESHYGNMIWIFNLADAYDNDRLQLDIKQRRIWWGRHKLSLLTPKKDFYFDIGDGRLVRPHNVYNQKPGWMSADVAIEPISSFIWEHSSLTYNQYLNHFDQ